MAKQLYITVSDALLEQIDKAVDCYNKRNLTRLNRTAWAERVLADVACAELDAADTLTEEESQDDTGTKIK